MFDHRHVHKKLMAYCHGELPEAEAGRVAAHLKRCARCREEHEALLFAASLAECLPKRPAPAHLWARIEAGLDERAAGSGDRRRPGLPGKLIFGFAFVALGVALLLGGVLRPWHHPGDASNVVAGPVVPTPGDGRIAPPRPAPPDTTVPRKNPGRVQGASWAVARLSGAPRIGSDRIRKTGRLREGEWLETDARSRAKVRVADIGTVEVEPLSRLRLVRTRKKEEHRIALERGTMRARVNAPPRLFFVDTPSAVAVDLGCAYTLTVDAAGASLLHVTSGYVAFERAGRESVVPADAACATDKTVGPGTPYFVDAPEGLRAALRRYDFGGGGEADLDTILNAARPRDTLTLYHLLRRVDPDDRGRVYDRLAALSPPPSGVTRDGMLRLDAGMLAHWKTFLMAAWHNVPVQFQLFPGLTTPGPDLSGKGATKK